MLEIGRKLRINKRFEASACSWCGDGLKLGEDGAVCEACESVHHARCWDEQRGCGLNSCINAPLSNLGLMPPGQEQTNSNETACPHCKKKIFSDEDICRYCGEIVSADGRYHGEQKLEREARLALICSIIGFFIAGLILGPIAFMKGRDAKKHIANNPRLKGRGVATAAQVLGVADLMFTLFMLIRLVGVADVMFAIVALIRLVGGLKQ